MDKQGMILAAPLQGYTDALWRKVHQSVYGEVGGAADRYFTPFIRVEGGGVRNRDSKGLEASLHDIPEKISAQIIFRDIEEFKLLADTVAETGCEYIDLNLGCPYPMQTRKGRGAATLGNGALLVQAAREMHRRPGIKWSAKMRLGMTDPEAWKRVAAALIDMPLEWLAVHPRVASQGYKGELHEGEVDAVIDAIPHPIVFNGEVKTPADIRGLYERFPRLEGVMIGRGLLARPSLIAEYISGEEWDEARRMEHILRMHDQMLEGYESAIEGGEHQLLTKMISFWEYLEPEIGHKLFKTIRKSKTHAAYLAALKSLTI